MSLGQDVSIIEVGGKVRETIENALEEAVAIPMDKGHRANTLGQLGPIWIVDEGDKMHQNLTKNGLGLVTSANSRNHCVHVDAKTQKIGDIDHSTDTCDGSLACGFLGINDIHDVLVGCLVLGRQLSIHETFVPLHEKC